MAALLLAHSVPGPTVGTPDHMVLAYECKYLGASTRTLICTLVVARVGALRGEAGGDVAVGVRVTLGLDIGFEIFEVGDRLLDGFELALAVGDQFLGALKRRDSGLNRLEAAAPQKRRQRASGQDAHGEATIPQQGAGSDTLAFVRPEKRRRESGNVHRVMSGYVRAARQGWRLKARLQRPLVGLMSEMSKRSSALARSSALTS